MCVILVVLSIIPVLSGYAIYLAIAAIATEASPALQVGFGLLGGFALYLGVRALWSALARRRNHRLPD